MCSKVKKEISAVNVVMQNALSRLSKLYSRGNTLILFNYFMHTY